MSVELSVVVPVFNEEENLEELYRRVTSVSARSVEEYEIVFVDDGSRDRTWPMIESLAGRDGRVRGVRLSRNFGHQMAFAAGVDSARGSAVVIMDGDLQDPPEVIPDLVARWREGWEVVYAVRSSRAGESAFKRATAAVFYRLLRRLTRVDVPVDTGDFRLMGPRAAAAFRRLPERHRYTRGLVAWLGFPQTGVTYDRAARHAGSSKFSLGRMMGFASDAVVAFSRLPLRLATWAGVTAVIVAIAAAGAGVALGAAGHGWSGWLFLTAALVFLGGVQLVAIGILGGYLGRVHDEVLGRPLYIVQETAGDDAPAPPTRE